MTFLKINFTGTTQNALALLKQRSRRHFKSRTHAVYRYCRRFGTVSGTKTGKIRMTFYSRAGKSTSDENPSDFGSRGLSSRPSFFLPSALRSIAAMRHRVANKIRDPESSRARTRAHKKSTGCPPRVYQREAAKKRRDRRSSRPGPRSPRPSVFPWLSVRNAVRTNRFFSAFLY